MTDTKTETIDGERLILDAIHAELQGLTLRMQGTADELERRLMLERADVLIKEKGRLVNRTTHGRKLRRPPTRTV